ncbi:NahK/ErcS family hybrid sensor histidine kinase/response regulator [Lentisalinibacter sediminis]|uniref:NahK/ErcS family hybrid sensor histidine kinase/response regulator n=1 Tax=Lentisalinibacter sediminis TaxID=2992237 RepID=UPI00386B5D38
MISWWLLVALSVAYVALLFGIASWGDRVDVRRYGPWTGPLVYSLSLAVYCTSWTFYGAVGSASQQGWSFLPIYLGPALVFLFGWGVIRRIIAISKRQNLTSIADFIAARYGKARSLAVLVTVIAIVGSVPYIALQFKAVVGGFDTISDYTNAAPALDTALVVAGALALFAILFGTRRVDATEHHHGMILAIAFESLVKLTAFVAVGLFALWLLGGDGTPMLAPMAGAGGAAQVPGPFSAGGLPQEFVTQTLLASAAIFCLPRQFHVAVVEAHEGADNRSARWMFPLYLAVFCLFVVPITLAGLRFLPPGLFAGDTYVLALPMQGGQDWLTALAFLGGFSAATGMVIVASVTLSTMVSNEIVMPLLLRANALGGGEIRTYPRLLLHVRRIAIVAIALIAYGYYRVMDQTTELASIGLLSFAAAAQFAPPILLGMYWPRATRSGAMAGLAAGFALWIYTLMLPSVARAGTLGSELVAKGPFGLGWARPEALLFDLGVDPLTHGVFWSLGANLGVFLLVSLASRQSVVERIQARAFTDAGREGRAHATPFGEGEIVVSDLRALAGRFVGEENARGAFEDFARGRGRELAPSATADRGVLQFTERLVAGTIGSASARIVMTTALRKTGMEIGDVLLLLDETSQAIRFNRQLLEATLENLSQGVTVVDASQRLIGWNSRYEEIMGYPPGLLSVGKPVTDLVRYNGARGRYGRTDVETRVAERARLLRAGSPFRYESEFSDGRVIEIRGEPMPDGGYVTTYSDITEFKQTERALRTSERQVRTYTDNAPALIAYVDADRRYRFANKAYLAYAGMSREEIIGAPLSAVLDERQLMARSQWLEAAYGGERQAFELEMTGADGESRYMLGTYIPDIDGDGAIMGVYAVFQDITERRRAELGLEEAKTMLEQRVADRTAELERAMSALAEAKAQAEAANVSKTRFLAAAAHDLLQPLNAAKLFTALLEEKSAGMSEEQRRLVSRVESGLIAVEDLLSALLDIARLDTRAPRPKRESFPAAELFATLEAQFGEAFAERELALRFVPTRLWVHTDPALLRRILQNFISNARRYTRSGGVLVGCRRRDDTVAIQVCDTGVGIAAENREAVFEEFRRLAGSDEGSKRGLGLGLAIVQRIARVLEHPLNMRSELGRGSCFEIVVPRAEPGRRPAPSTAEPRPLSSMDGHHVLCIDNEPDILDGMQGLLARWGARPLPAADLDGASRRIAALQEETGERPSVLLVDYHLNHGVTGLEVIEAVRAMTASPVPAVVLTADYSQEVADAVREAGHALLHKPVKPAALRALVTRIIGRT